jgi:hypothetical protein
MSVRVSITATARSATTGPSSRRTKTKATARKATNVSSDSSTSSRSPAVPNGASSTPVAVDSGWAVGWRSTA